MKKYFVILLFATLALGLCLPSAFAQASGTVKGVCRDAQGQPVVDGIVLWANQDNGQKYTLKTNKRGEYFSLGLTPGKYNVILYKSADDQKAGKEMDHLNGFVVKLDENTIDLDVKKEMEDTAKGKGVSAEEFKKAQEQNAKAEKEKSTVGKLNDKLNAAKTAADGGDYDTAIAALTEATQMDATRDLIWFKLADYYRLSATKQTDPAEKQKRLDSAVESYQKAVDLKKATPDKDPAKQAQNLAAYYNNLADAYYKAKKIDDAVKTYELAAQTDPSAAAQSYFNIGAVLTNSGRPDEANTAFDKCLAADPNKAEAYYQKGLNLLGKATLQGDKTIAPPGTAEAFQKYLELSPTGPNAQSAKDLLASIGAKVETTYGTKKKSSKN
ncbi:MAG TPA: tetratricopeptide repeat protein [Candidatus Sulfotelmatobacter sp.]|nr:tetratricopeptide repeat protein [Candidatus Sulfotelmatobacter sp.]